MAKVIFAKSAFKDLAGLPSYIVSKLKVWVCEVEMMGVEAARRSPGYHDEPLKGKRAGQRSIRLNKAYRAIYEEAKDGREIIVRVVEVNKHEY